MQKREVTWKTLNKTYLRNLKLLIININITSDDEKVS